jgi:hypothetical protein
MDKTSIDVPGATFTGNITIHGDMFNIHDNQHVHVNVNRQPQQMDEEDYEYVDFVFFNDRRLSTMESQMKFRRVLKSVLPRMDVDSGRDWVAVYIAYHYYIGREFIMKGQSDFFKDIDALLPGVLTKVNDQETSCDKRYKAYSDLLRLECPKWFILDECLPPMREWTSKRFEYQVDDSRRRRIQQLVKDIYQGLKKEDL